MKNADIAQNDLRFRGRGHASVPRGWVILGAALAAWLIVVLLGGAALKLFWMLSALF